MKTSYDYGKTGKKIICILMAVIYMVIIANVTRLGSTGEVPLFKGASVLGILTALEFLIALLMVAIEYEVGGALAIVVVSISFINSIIPIILSKSLNALPGLLNCIACLIAVITIRNQFKLERQKVLIDDLTGIGNRNGMLQYMNFLISSKTPFYAILLDVDHFKRLNDALGHTNGDELLKELANKWKEVDSRHAVIGRLGGDGFLVVIKKKYCDNISIPVQKYIDVVEKMAKSPKSNCPTLTISTGVVEYPAFGTSVDELLKNADISVRKAQQTGRNVCVVYQDSIENEVIREQYVETRIKDALNNNLFYMVYQPQYNAYTKKIRGFESLIRMNPAGDEPVYPGEFIPVAEATNLINDIGSYVIRRVISDFTEVVKENPDIIVSVNVSAKQLLKHGFVDSLQDILEDTGFPAKNLEIEITEYCMMDTASEAVEIVKDMKSMGIKLAMDDFGTGFSSLSYLAKLPIDLLKIDKILIDNMGEGEIIEAICSMSHALNCEVIAEGVENETQLELLKAKNCNYIQGYIWSKPVEYEQVLSLVKQ